jgi:hypothetical protein
MRKLKLLAAGPNGEMDWMMWIWEDNLKKYVNDLTDRRRKFIGRKMAIVL